MKHLASEDICKMSLKDKNCGSMSPENLQSYCFYFKSERHEVSLLLINNRVIQSAISFAFNGILRKIQVLSQCWVFSSRESSQPVNIPAATCCAPVTVGQCDGLSQGRVPAEAGQSLGLKTRLLLSTSDRRVEFRDKTSEGVPLERLMES